LTEESAAAGRTRIQLCGRLSVEIDGLERAPALRGRQVALLLAYLVLDRGRQIGREELSLALWPERAPRSQDAALRTLLSRLRSALGRSALGGRDQLVLSLPEPIWVDVEAATAALEAARAAVDGGDARRAWALAQVPLNVSARGLLPGYEALWLEVRRRELAELRLGTLEVLGRAGLTLGGTQLASAERAARTLIDAEPYRESGYVLLMETLALQGNLAEGLRAFEQLRARLRDELGIAPSPETIAAHERLLHPAPPPAPVARAAAVRIALPAELAVAPRMELVGRERELAEFDRLWAAIHEGDGELPAGRVGLVAGEPGVGKTRLLGELARRVHARGAVVLAGRCTQEALAPYQPFVEALRHYAAQAPEDHLRATAADHGAELARLLPELRRRLGRLPPPAPAEPEFERYRLFEAVAGVLAEIAASTPLLVVLDDLHWADRPTLLLLHHLARAPGHARVPILGAYRVSEAEREPLRGALSELRHERVVTEFRLVGLSTPETAKLVRARTGILPPLALARALQEQTEGNPLFVLQIIRRLLQAGVELATAGLAELRSLGLPDDLKRTIAQRLAGLGRETEEWLRAAAVIGRDFDAALLERVTAIGDEQFFSALEDSLKAGVIVPQPGNRSRVDAYGYRFSHPLIRETLYEDIPGPRRARLHKRVAEAIEGLQRSAAGVPPEGPRVAMLAQHFARSPDPNDAPKAIRYARLAGERATDMLAYEEAAEHYARALELQERFEPDDPRLRLELLLALSESFVRGGDRPLSVQPLRQAADIAIQLSDVVSLARTAIAASRRYIQPPGVVDKELIALLERALELTAGQMTTLRVILLARMCGALYYAEQWERTAALSAEATMVAAELDDPQAQAHAAAARRRAFWTPAHLEQRLSDSADMVRFAREAGDVELALHGHAWLVVDLLEQGDLDAVEAQIEAFEAGAAQVNQALYDWQAAVWRGMRALLRGRLQEAEALAERALQTGARAEAITASQYYAIQLLVIRREQRRIAELEPGLRQIIERYPNRRAYRAALGVLLSETERLDQAPRELAPLAAEGFAGIPRDGDWLITMALLADVYAELGEAEQAARLYELLLPFETANVVIGLGAACEGPAARLLGRLAAVTGRPDAAAAHFERALQRAERLRAPVYTARTQLDYAQAFGGRGDLLEAASRIVGEHGLVALERRASRLRSG
jgi:DNA-binding SARP family transcriptional activator